jgi:uncharacterized RDD family membrane protein YckC
MAALSGGRAAVHVLTPVRTADVTEAVPPASPSYVGLVTRMIALTLDAVLIDLVAVVVSGAVLVVLSVFSVAGDKLRPVLIVIGSVLFVVWVVSYFVVLWTTTGQTIGSRVMAIQVVRSDGSRLKPRHALVRLAGMAISLPLFWGYLPILVSAKRRAVFDVMAGTIVTVAPALPAGGDPVPITPPHP